MWLKTNIILFFLLFWIAAPIQAGLFGISPKDRKEFTEARQTFNDGNYEKAVQQLTDYIYKTKNIKRREARAYRLLGLAYERLNNPAKALELYQEALEFHEKDVPLLLAAASLYQRSGLTDQSILLYDRALKREPENQEALAGQAENYIHMGFYSMALQYYHKFFLLNQQAPSIKRARYAYAFLKQRDFIDAFIHITMAKEQEPTNANYWLLSARAYKGLNMMKEALADLDMAIFLTKEHKEELTILKSMWLYQQGFYDQSLEIANQLLAQDPQEELALFMQYMNRQKLGQAQQAKQALEKIKNLKKESFAQRVVEKLLAE